MADHEREGEWLMPVRPESGMKPAMIIDGEREQLLRAFLTGPAIGRRRAGPEALDRYHRALTHRSYTREAGVPSDDNERLEFLGDRVLNLIVAEFLFRNYRNGLRTGTSPGLSLRRISALRISSW